jgi:hypothetical protein
MFFVLKYIKIIFFYFLKRFKTYKKKLIFIKKIIEFLKITVYTAFLNVLNTVYCTMKLKWCTKKKHGLLLIMKTRLPFI